MNWAYTILVLLLMASKINGQLEVTYIDDQASSDLILYSQAFGETTYLINKCGEIINSWQHDNRAGFTARLLDNGNLIRAERVDDACCDQTSAGGRIQIIDWDQTVQWDFMTANLNETQHHDFIVMPNGNIMYLGWEVMNRGEMDGLGIIDGPDELWSEFVREVKPVGQNQFELVWEWNLKYHLIQDLNPALGNYRADIKNHPGKVDPHVMNQPKEGKWHVNALTYDPVRDVVIINSRDNHEFWIIDHGVTIAGAKGNVGGRYGKGGQILFRWGNPYAYGRGDIDEITMFGSHGLTVIPKGERFEDYILFFNNDQSSPGVGRFSTVELIKPMTDAQGNYVLGTDSTYLLEDHIIIYGDDQDAEPLYSKYMSNAQQLPNGYLINEGSRGRIFEINDENEVTWEVQSTFWLDDVFRAYSYPRDFIGFENKDMSPKNTEFIANEFEVCNTLDIDSEPSPSFRVAPNPFSNYLDIELKDKSLVQLFSFSQQDLINIELEKGASRISLDDLAAGLYYLSIKNNYGTTAVKLVKN